MSASVNFWRVKGGGQVGKGWVGQDCSPGTSLCGHGPLFDGPERLAGDAVEDIQEAELGGLRDHVHRLAVVAYGEQLGAGGEVVIPEIVVDGLKMPEAFAGARIEREKAVAEEIGAVRSAP